jgi:hypothetical protein
VTSADEASGAELEASLGIWTSLSRVEVMGMGSSEVEVEETSEAEGASEGISLPELEEGEGTSDPPPEEAEGCPKGRGRR